VVAKEADIKPVGRCVAHCNVGVVPCCILENTPTPTGGGGIPVSSDVIWRKKWAKRYGQGISFWNDVGA
jgi:hypothetical protein